MKSEKPDFLSFLSSAIRAAEAAGEVLTRHFRKKLIVSEKVGAGLVTNADLEAQEVSVAILKKAHPEFGFLTEEAAPEPSQGPGRWIIDPLDGTTNFVHGFPMFCVSIAAEWEDEVVVGVIYHPILKELYTAVRGQGAQLNGQAIHVSSTHRLEKALLSTQRPFKKLNQTCRGIRRPGSAALDLAYTASGIFDGYWEKRISPWDVAAGVLLVTEAGGTVTTLDGKLYQLDQPNILASNSILHVDLLKGLSET